MLLHETLFFRPALYSRKWIFDFKRYTKEQFHIDDHYRLVEEVHRLVDLGCYVLLTNSNHPVVHELYERFEVEVIPTRRSINKHGARRRGEDVIVKCVPEHWPERSKVGKQLLEQRYLYPRTRLMGSKYKLLEDIRDVTKQFDFDTLLIFLWKRWFHTC